MELKDWIGLGRGRGKALARFIRLSPSFVSNMARGERQIPVVLMPAIEAFTRGQVTRQEMLPDGWRQQWPELCGERPEDIWPELVALAGDGLAPEGQGTRPAAGLTTDPALNVALVGAEQAGLVKLPHPAPAWDGAERRVSPVPRRAADRLDIAAGQGAA